MTSSSSGFGGGSGVYSPSEPLSDGGFGLQDLLRVRSLVPSKWPAASAADIGGYLRIPTGNPRQIETEVQGFYKCWYWWGAKTPVIEGDEPGDRAGGIHVQSNAGNDRGCDVDGPQPICGGRSMSTSTNLPSRMAFALSLVKITVIPASHNLPTDRSDHLCRSLNTWACSATCGRLPSFRFPDRWFWITMPWGSWTFITSFSASGCMHWASLSVK